MNVHAGMQNLKLSTSNATAAASLKLTNAAKA